MSKKIIIDKQWLYEQYVVNNLSVYDIAIKLKCKRFAVTRRLKEYNIPIKTNNQKTLITVGDRFNCLVVEKEIKKGSHRFYLCQCDCGKKTTVNKWNLISNITKSCGCLYESKFTHYGEISGTYWQHTVKSAKGRGIKFDLTIEECWDLFVKQNRKCNLSGVELQFSKSDNRTVQTASLDRIKSDDYYHIGNVQWVHKDINRMKSDFEEEKFLDWANKIYNYKISKIQGENKWDIRFLSLAKHISNFSKDNSTKVGAIIVRQDKTICSTGYNGFAKSMPDLEENYINREEKYSRIIHAEMNAFIHSKEPVKGYSLYVYPFPPCDRCIVHMIQAGIIRYIFPSIPEDKKARWGVSMERTKQYIIECGATYLEIPHDNL